MCVTALCFHASIFLRWLTSCFFDWLDNSDLSVFFIVCFNLLAGFVFVSARFRSVAQDLGWIRPVSYAHFEIRTKVSYSSSSMTTCPCHRCLFQLSEVCLQFPPLVPPFLVYFSFSVDGIQAHCRSLYLCLKFSFHWDLIVSTTGMLLSNKSARCTILHLIIFGSLQ